EVQRKLSRFGGVLVGHYREWEGMPRLGRGCRREPDEGRADRHRQAPRGGRTRALLSIRAHDDGAYSAYVLLMGSTAVRPCACPARRPRLGPKPARGSAQCVVGARHRWSERAGTVPMFADRAKSIDRSVLVGDTELTCPGSRSRARYSTDDKFFTAFNRCRRR